MFRKPCNKIFTFRASSSFLQSKFIAIVNWWCFRDDIKTSSVDVFKRRDHNVRNGAQKHTAHIGRKFGQPKPAAFSVPIRK